MNLPENFPDKKLINKKAKFNCKIINVKKPEDVKINDEFAKNLGAKDLADLKNLISKQINEEYKNSLDMIAKRQILEEIEKNKLEEIPKNLIEQEIKILSQGMKEEDLKKNKKKIEDQAKKRIKTGIILNAFGEKNEIKVTEQEMNSEIQKQFQMMPGQEKMLKEYYEKNPSILENLRGSLYEEKIINKIKEKGNPKKKQISKDEADRLLKQENEKNLKSQNNLPEHDHSSHDHSRDSSKKTISSKKLKSSTKKSKTTKKVSKK